MNKQINKMKIGVIGMGPVGSILAAHLIEAGVYVVVCDNGSDRINEIKKNGIVLKHSINKHIQVKETCSSLHQLKKYDVDLVIIAVKVTALDQVHVELLDIATDKMYVLCAQNGIGNELKVSKVCGEDKTLRMVINYAGNINNDNTVNVSFFNPPNYVAAMLPQADHMAKKLSELLSSTGIETKVSKNIQNYVWRKAILNAAISPICAITQKTMKDVMSFPKTFKLVEGIIDESIKVADMEGIELGKNFRQFCIQYLKKTGQHKPSMLIDFESGRDTEIDFLNGKIVKYGQKHYLPTPFNQSVTALIHLLEYSNNNRSQ
jgi:2-dehydropantoate 2-reductase